MTRTTSTARTTSMAKAVKKERKKEIKAKEKKFPWLLKVMWQVGAQGE